jgi:amidase
MTYNLDALIMRSFASLLLPGLAGLPVITVPLGSYPQNASIMKTKRGDLISTGPNIP